MLFTDFMKNWLSSKELLIERSTYEAYEIYVNRHIIPYFKPYNLDLTELKPLNFRNYIQYKMKGGRLDNKDGGLSKVSIRKHLSIMKQVLNEAVILEYIERNPAFAIKLPKIQSISNSIVFLNISEAQTMLKAFDGHILKPVVLITLYYGLRRSEILGLKWSAIDFNNDIIYIRHTVVKNVTIECKDKTKSICSNRSYQLLPEIKTMLLKLRDKQENDRKTIKGYIINDYIFKWSNGRLMRPDYITRGFQRVLKSHGLKKMRFHDLRHSTASILFEKGWSQKDVQEWLGHADIETTMNIYVHLGRIRKVMKCKELVGMFAK